ncbi:MAG: S4 domain-containing protein [Proteobacteria bacterium]|nr:S4 domain-containing protein [Pseudomonadota bacterium]
MPMQELSYSINSQDLGRLDLLLTRLLSFSRARVRGLLDHGGVQLNGQPCKDAGYLLKLGDQLSLCFDPERRYREKPFVPSPRGFSVVYQDDYLVLVNKEAGILSVPTERGESNSLLDLLSRHINYKQASRGKLSVVHRLDRDTSGLLLFGAARDWTEKSNSGPFFRNGAPGHW